MSDAATVPPADDDTRLLKLFVCGDVMTGRGIDQVLPHPGDPGLHESYLKSARKYVELAEERNGRIPAPVSFDYIWGDALAELRTRQPQARIVNLETTVTTSDTHWPGKRVHYRMHPDNIGCLTAAGIDVCALANNHVLDWQQPGLEESLSTLQNAGIKTCGAGADLTAARQPAVVNTRKGRVVVHAWGLGSAGLPADWLATGSRPGVNWLPDLSDDTTDGVIEHIRTGRQPGDVVIVSLHWGSNWGYDVSPDQTRFAHRLIDEANVAVIHGHSSHHPRPMEVYRDRLILYGCGDFINDYEGISGYEEYRPDRTLMYFPTIDPANGRLAALTMLPMHLVRFRLQRALSDDAAWLARRLSQVSAKFGTKVKPEPDGGLALDWS